MKITANAESPKKIPKSYSLKWSKKLTEIKTSFDKTAVIFLGEILHEITNDKVVFASAGKIDYDMFGSCDYAWSLTSGIFMIKRQLEREISDGLQRVEVITDEVILSGFTADQFSWNGDCGECMSTLTVKIELKNKESIKRIKALGLELYESFSIS